jgi:hypothetical protein
MFVEDPDHPIHSCLNALRSALPSEPKQYSSSVMTANEAKMESVLAGFLRDGENELLPNLSESFRSRYGLSSAENRVLETVLTRFARAADSALAAAKIFMETSFEDDECLAAAKAMLGSLIEILAMNELCAGYRLIQRKWGIPDEDDSGPIF